MGFFKNSKGNRKRDSVTIAGEEFLLVEPSAYDRMVYLEKLNEHVEQEQENGDNLVKQNQLWYSLNCYLIAICLTEHFSGQSVDEIWKMTKCELTESDIEDFIPKVEEVSNLKLGGESGNSPTEPLPED